MVSGDPSWLPFNKYRQVSLTQRRKPLLKQNRGKDTVAFSIRPDAQIVNEICSLWPLFSKNSLLKLKHSCSRKQHVFKGRHTQKTYLLSFAREVSFQVTDPRFQGRTRSALQRPLLTSRPFCRTIGLFPVDRPKHTTTESLVKCSSPTKENLKRAVFSVLSPTCTKKSVSIGKHEEKKKARTHGRLMTSVRAKRELANTSL